MRLGLGLGKIMKWCIQEVLYAANYPYRWWQVPFSAMAGLIYFLFIFPLEWWFSEDL